MVVIKFVFVAAVGGQRKKVAHVLWKLRRLVSDVVLRRNQPERARSRRGTVRQRLPARVRHQLFRRDGRHRGRLAQTRPRRL